MAVKRNRVTLPGERRPDASLQVLPISFQARIMTPDVRPPAPDLLSDLRAATAAAHERLDAGFSGLALATREGYARFLRAHALGMAPLFAPFRAFLEDELRLPCPDYPTLLAADLAALGEPSVSTGSAAESVTDLDPTLEAPGAGAGVAYVVCGSRLGLAVIRQRGTWGETHGIATRYIADMQGHAAWKALVPRLRATQSSDPATNAESRAARAAALFSFNTFARAFAVSAACETIPQGASLEICAKLPASVNTARPTSGLGRCGYARALLSRSLSTRNARLLHRTHRPC
jgi:heme oxygenase